MPRAVEFASGCLVSRAGAMVDGVGFGRDSSLLVRLCLCLPTQEKSPAVFAVGGEVSATPDNPPLSFSPLK
eukprot:667878-Prorocentrum_minimum.AAC.1